MCDNIKIGGTGPLSQEIKVPEDKKGSIVRSRLHLKKRNLIQANDILLTGCPYAGAPAQGEKISRR